jgi:tetratricopeptide (TPR) repeat protein
MTAQNNLELQGNFATHPFVELLVELSQASLTGSLRVAFEDKKSIVYFENGKIVFAVSNARKLKLPDTIRALYPEKAAEMSRFSNDLELLKHLQAEASFPDEMIDKILANQLNAILLEVLGWPDGEWKFDPLARARPDVRASVDVGLLLLNYARSIPAENIRERFRSFTERFMQVEEPDLAIHLDTEEAFLFSRFQGSSQTINEVIEASGMDGNVVLKTLYSLWLAGLLTRSDWNPAFSPKKVGAIRSANLVLKQSATPIAKSSKNVEIGDLQLPVQEEVKPEKPEPAISIDDYLKRVEGADSLYEVLGLPNESSMAAIRKSYFSLAKQFHPDKFHRGEQGLLRRIESAFSTLAQAYETLKDTKSRDLYDSKLKRERAERANREPQGPASGGNPVHSERAAQEFEHGRGLLMDGDWAESLPFLARAVHFVPQNARYHAFYGKALSNDESQRHKAVNAMQKAVTLDPQNAAFRMMLAEFLVKVNLVKRAEGELTRLLQLQPDHAEARSLLDSLGNK